MAGQAATQGSRRVSDELGLGFSKATSPPPPRSEERGIQGPVAALRSPGLPGGPSLPQDTLMTVLQTTRDL